MISLAKLQRAMTSEVKNGSSMPRRQPCAPKICRSNGHYMTNDDWFNWQVRALFEQFAEILRFQVSVAEVLLEDAEAWFFATHADTEMCPTNATQMKYSASGAPESSPTLSSLKPREVGMPSIDEIMANARRELDHSYREAFDAGRDHVASELKRRMAAMFEGLADSYGSPRANVRPPHSDGHSPDQAE